MLWEEQWPTSKNARIVVKLRLSGHTVTFMNVENANAFFATNVLLKVDVLNVPQKML